MHRRTLRFLKKAGVYTLLEALILVSLTFISWGFDVVALDALATAFVFTGIYLLIGSLAFSGLSQKPSSPPTFSMGGVQNPYRVTRVYSRGAEVLVGERAVKKEREPAAALYGYFMGAVLFFLGLVLVMA